jgi:hypothetical protein
MFRFHSKICIAVAEKLAHSRHYYNIETDLSYICLNNDELVLIATKEKFQILGQPSVKWHQGHLIDIEATAKRLVLEVVKQVSAFENDDKSITTAKEWFVEVGRNSLKKVDETDYSCLESIKKLETQIWVNHLKNQESPILQDFAIFLCYFLSDDERIESSQSSPHYRELLESEIAEASNLANFLINHSNELLREGAGWIPEWIAAH